MKRELFNDSHIKIGKNAFDRSSAEMPQMSRNVIGRPKGFVVTGVMTVVIWHCNEQGSIWLQQRLDHSYLLIKIRKMLKHVPQGDDLKLFFPG